MNNNMTQLELHKRIEEFFKAGVESADVKVAQDLLVNDDAKQYFFAQADKLWLDWLWQNNFLDDLNNKAEDPTNYTYRMPELEYLSRMAEKNPAEVAQIINSIKISETNFNPEVVDRFLRIINILPAKQSKTLTIKIRDERWAYLMRDFRKTGYEFEKIIKELVKKKKNNAILELAQAIFIMKSKAEMQKKDNQFFVDDPFYVSNLDESGIFEALADIEESYAEKTLQVMTDIMAEIVKLAESDNTKVFDYVDLYSLFDVDFFTLQIKNKRSVSGRENMKNIAATIKKLVERTIGAKCENADEAKRLFKYIDDLPSCRSIWRLKLFTMAQCPKVFEKELREAFFKLFEVENYYEIEGGTEYKKALKITFSHLSDIDQRDYIAKVLKYFSKKAEQHSDQNWHKRTGWEILSSICNYLENDEFKKCEEVFGRKCDEEYKPEPTISRVSSGAVHHRSPENLDKFTIDEILANLKSKWTPEKLDEQFKDDDFFNRRGVEGLGDNLKEDVKKRTDAYLKNINSFFDRSNIHSHYMYSLLRGIEEMLRNKQLLNLGQVSQILGLFEIIENDGKQRPFKKRDDKSWLVDWIGVHGVITDILLYILEDVEKKAEIHKAHRAKIKNLISYLITIKDSPSEEDEKLEYGEPYHIAINSVRGRAYEAFVVFTENDGKVLSNDIKEIYRKTLEDNSLAVRFVVGRYLPSFYFRDKDFISSLFPEIFPRNDPDKKDIYLATWEGYLSNTLYDKLFVALKDYYSHAITLNPEDYTKRKYFKGLDESLAVHIALAFAHLDLKIGNPLFEQFWKKTNIARHKEFISFIGRSCLTRSQAGDEWLKENKVSKKRLVEFWDWVLENVSEPKALSGFGFWVNPDKEILDDNTVVKKMAQTLKKSDGNIDWDYGLFKRLSVFAEKDESKTLEIISNYLLNSNGNISQDRRTSLLYDNEIKESLDIIYKNGNVSTRQKVVNLISTLIEKGSSAFWYLKKVINEN